MVSKFLTAICNTFFPNFFIDINDIILATSSYFFLSKTLRFDWYRIEILSKPGFSLRGYAVAKSVTHVSHAHWSLGGARICHTHLAHAFLQHLFNPWLTLAPIILSFWKIYRHIRPPLKMFLPFFCAEICSGLCEEDQIVGFCKVLYRLICLDPRLYMLIFVQKSTWASRIHLKYTPFKISECKDVWGKCCEFISRFCKPIPFCNSPPMIVSAVNPPPPSGRDRRYYWWYVFHLDCSRSIKTLRLRVILLGAVASTSTQAWRSEERIHVRPETSNETPPVHSLTPTPAYAGHMLDTTSWSQSTYRMHTSIAISKVTF